MARRTAYYDVIDEGRDKGKRFLLTEMPAIRGEAWALRVIMAVANTGYEVPEDIKEAGLAGLATIALPLLLRIPYYVAEPLLAEMFTCIEIVPDPERPNVHRKLIDDDIEEVVTRIKLRREVLDLHVGFSVTAAILSLAADALIPSNGRAASTSPDPSKSPSAAASPPTGS